MKKEIKVLISACLLGDNVKYSGGNNLTPELVTLLEKYNVDIVKVCPECFVGLPIPRVPSEIRENKVFKIVGKILMILPLIFLIISFFAKGQVGS